jgi:predicted SAM-dependent methyltransferase
MDSPPQVRLGPAHPDGLRRVNVGCGPTNLLEGWWNVDIRSFEGIDEVMDCTKPWPWEDLGFVYGEHFIEHMEVPDCISFLVHAGASLVRGGRIRLSTPSLEWVLSTHFNLGDPAVGSRIAETWAINRAFHGWGHKFLYSREMLLYILSSLGFESLSFHDYGCSDCAELSGKERHGGWTVANGFPSVWIVEASKGSRDIVEAKALQVEVEESLFKYVRAGH